MGPYRYLSYGVPLASDCPFPDMERLPPGRRGSQGGVRFARWDSLAECSISRWVPFQGSRYGWSRNRRRVLLRSPWIGRFLVDLDGRTVLWRPVRGASLETVQEILGKRVLALLLPGLGRPLALHAHAPVIGGRAVAFMGPQGSGKSTLGASFLEAGFPLLSDDLAVLQERDGRHLVHPGPRRISLWPGPARLLAGKKVGTVRGIPGSRKKEFLLEGPAAWNDPLRPAPLGGLCFLDRKRGGVVRVEKLRGKEALIGLLRNLYHPFFSERAVSTAQLEAARAAARRVPVFKLTYPSGFRHLPGVRRALLSALGAA